MSTTSDIQRAALTRREFVMGAGLAGACLVVGAVAAETGAETAPQFGRFGPFLRIAPDGAVTVISKHSELGQGSQSGLAAIVAEELDADWRKVSVEMAPAVLNLYAHVQFKVLQITGGSSSISNSWTQLRRAGAAARAMLVSAAATTWQVPAAELTVHEGVITHASSGRSLGFGALIEAASREPVPAEPVLKPVESFTLLGTDRVTRLDARAKSTGTQRFTLDVDEPGLLTALVAHSPRFGGKVASVDDAAARAIPGVVDVFEIPSGVAVVANGYYAARRGRDALQVRWNDEAAERRSSAQILADHRALAADPATAWQSFESIGEVAPAAEGEAVEFEYDFPYVAHAAMEPMNCVARVDGRQVRLSYGAQSQTADQINIASVLGIEPGAVEIETLHAGGSFGRRSAPSADVQRECVHIARRIGGGRPVRLQWTREDDMAGGYYRPVAHHALKLRVAADGYPAEWRHRMVSASLLAGTAFERPGVDTTVVEGVHRSPYFKAIPFVRGEVFCPKSPVPVLWLRSVGATHTAMVMEHTIDRLARRAGIDPLEYRRVMYRRAGAERHLQVLELAVAKAGWGTPLESGWARGIAVHECFGSVVANIAEVRMQDGEPRVRRVVAAVDCGFAVAPDQVRAQMEGGVNYGLSFALYGNVVLDEGVVTSTNFNSYRVLRMSEAPVVETHILRSANAPSGVGEPGTPVIGPAVANAMLALTGKPTSVLPLVKA